MPLDSPSALLPPLIQAPLDESAMEGLPGFVATGESGASPLSTKGRPFAGFLQEPQPKKQNTAGPHLPQGPFVPYRLNSSLKPKPSPNCAVTGPSLCKPSALAPKAPAAPHQAKPAVIKSSPEGVKKNDRNTGKSLPKTPQTRNNGAPAETTLAQELPSIQGLLEGNPLQLAPGNGLNTQPSPEKMKSPSAAPAPAEENKSLAPKMGYHKWVQYDPKGAHSSPWAPNVLASGKSPLGRVTPDSPPDHPPSQYYFFNEVSPVLEDQVPLTLRGSFAQATAAAAISENETENPGNIQDGIAQLSPPLLSTAEDSLKPQHGISGKAAGVYEPEAFVKQPYSEPFYWALQPEKENDLPAALPEGFPAQQPLAEQTAQAVWENRGFERLPAEVNTARGGALTSIPQALEKLTRTFLLKNPESGPLENGPSRLEPQPAAPSFQGVEPAPASYPADDPEDPSPLKTAEAGLASAPQWAATRRTHAPSGKLAQGRTGLKPSWDGVRTTHPQQQAQDLPPVSPGAVRVQRLPGEEWSNPTLKDLLNPSGTVPSELEKPWETLAPHQRLVLMQANPFLDSTARLENLSESSNPAGMPTSLSPQQELISTLQERFERAHALTPSWTALTLPLSSGEQVNLHVRLVNQQLQTRFEKLDRPLKEALNRGWAQLAQHATRRSLSLAPPQFLAP